VQKTEHIYNTLCDDGGG